MKVLDFSWTYPTHPTAVFQMATRLEHLDQKAHHLGHHGHAVKELRERGGVFRSVTTRQVEVELPWYAYVVKYTPRNYITQTQLWQPPEWDGSRRYEALVEVTRVPVRITGWGRLLAVDIGRTRYDIHLEVSSRAFLIGPIVEAQVTRNLQLNIDAEHDFRMLWLQRTLNI